MTLDFWRNNIIMQQDSLANKYHKAHKCNTILLPCKRSEGSHKQNYVCKVLNEELETFWSNWSFIHVFRTNYFQCPHGIWHIYSKIIAHYATQLRRLTQAKLWLPSSHWRVRNTTLVTHILMTPFCHLQWHLKSSKIIALMNVILLLEEIRKLTHACKTTTAQFTYWRVGEHHTVHSYFDDTILSPPVTFEVQQKYRIMQCDSLAGRDQKAHTCKTTTVKFTLKSQDHHTGHSYFDDTISSPPVTSDI